MAVVGCVDGGGRAVAGGDLVCGADVDGQDEGGLGDGTGCVGGRVAVRLGVRVLLGGLADGELDEDDEGDVGGESEGGGLGVWNSSLLDVE